MLKQVWRSWSPLASLGPLTDGGCTVCVNEQVATLFVNTTFDCEIQGTSVTISMLSNVISAWRVVACVHIDDCTEGEEPRVARGHIVLDGDECTIHTHGIFLAGRRYAVHAQTVFRLRE